MLEKYHDILTVADVQEILFVSRNTAYNLLRSGQLHSFKVGNNWRIPIAAVKDYIGYKPKPNKTTFSI
jgi:excisionase family DNA binding protein